MYNPHTTILQGSFSCALVDAIDLKKYIVVNGFVIAVCNQLQSLQQRPAHHGLDINEKNCAFSVQKTAYTGYIASTADTVYTVSTVLEQKGYCAYM